MFYVATVSLFQFTQTYSFLYSFHVILTYIAPQISSPFIKYKQYCFHGRHINIT